MACLGEDTCNENGTRVVYILNEMELVICNGRQLVLEPEWTRVRPSLDQKSVIDYVITDSQLMKDSGVVQVDRTDIGASDHYLVFLELGRTTKQGKTLQRTIKSWWLDRLENDKVIATS